MQSETPSSKQTLVLQLAAGLGLHSKACPIPLECCVLAAVILEAYFGSEALCWSLRDAQNWKQIAVLTKSMAFHICADGRWRCRRHASLQPRHEDAQFGCGNRRATAAFGDVGRVLSPALFFSSLAGSLCFFWNVNPLGRGI